VTGRERRTRITAAALVGLVAGMVGLSFASVPLYRMFCQATGYGGTPKTEGVVRPTAVADAQVTVRFDANVNSGLPWRFQPEQRQVRLRLGEETLVHFTAANLSDQPITGTATFNVVPEKVARYFSKLECFCFTEQTLAPRQEVSMPVVFFVDPALARDATARDATTITLSYTFFRAGSDGQPQGKARKVAATQAAGAGG
jgi:cytochrome c oxidase assembly protein subunit 11